jgi:regulator of sirC expression with transglutaminase-like and TPR domain
MSVRELIESYRRELRDEDLSPNRAAEVLQRLTALLGNVLSEIREAEAAYNLVLLTALDADEAANRATIRAKTTPEYARSREAQDTQKVLVEMIRSLKVVLKSQQEEMRLTR